MIFTWLFYHGKLHIGLLVLVLSIGTVIFGIINFGRSGNFWGRSGYERVELISVLSFGNFYDGKKICTRGFFVQGVVLTVIKVRLDEDIYTRSAWVDLNDHEIITRFPGAPDRSRDVLICGRFESSRGGEFGEPSIWKHQITVESYRTFGDAKELGTSI